MQIAKELLDAMIAIARDQRERAYAPYSNFRVGAAVLGGSGKVYAGSNVENASYGLTICAERAAILRAISDGEHESRAVVICTAGTEPAPPCGACLQVMAEFCPEDEPTVIITCAADVTQMTCVSRTLDEYLPVRFALG